MSECAGKAVFSTAGLALKRIVEINKKHDRKIHRKPIRFYECTHCGLFHLTSKTEEARALEEQAKNPPADIKQQLEERLKFYGLK